MATKSYSGTSTVQLTFDAKDGTENVLKVSNITGWSEYRDGDDLIIFSSNEADYLTVVGAYAAETRLDYIEYYNSEQQLVAKRFVSTNETVPSSGQHFFAGTSANDEIVGGSASSISATGYLGDDKITGTDGSDYINGNAGNDQIFGLEGDDVLIGGSDNDTLDGGSGDDTLNAGDGNDTSLGGNGNDIFIVIDNYTDNIDIANIEDLDTSNVLNIFDIGGDNDTVAISDTPGLDSYRFVNSDDAVTFQFASGRQVIIHKLDDGSVPIETFRWFSEPEFGNSYQPYQADFKIVTDLNDILDTSTMFAGTDNAEVITLPNISTNGGLDTGSSSWSELYFNGGDDMVTMSNDFNFIVHMGAGNDTVLGTDNSIGSAYLGEGNDVFDGLAASDWSFGSYGDDSMLGRGGDDTLLGSFGNDTLDGGDGDDYLDGGSGDDNLSAGDGNDTLLGGDGDDDFHDDWSGNDHFDGGNGFDRLFTLDQKATSGAVIDVKAGTITSRFFPPAWSDVPEQDEIDTFTSIEGFGGTDQDDTFLGSDVDEAFYGNGGNDSALAGAGDDILIGGSGNDTLDGGDGDDTAIFEGSFEDAEIYVKGDAVYVQTVSGGSDMLTGIENLKFDDRTVGINVDGLQATSYFPTTEIYAYQLSGITINGENNADGDWIIKSDPSEAIAIVYGSADLEFSIIQDRTYEDDYSHLMSVSQGELYDLQINGLSVGDPRFDIGWTALETVKLGTDSEPVQIFSVDGVMSLYENWSWGAKDVSNVLYVDNTPLFDKVPTKAELQKIVENVDGGVTGYTAESSDQATIKMSDITKGVRVSDIPNSSDGITTDYDAVYDGDSSEYTFAGFSVLQTWSEEDGGGEIISEPSKATLIIRGSSDLKIYSEAFYGDDYETDRGDYDQELRIISGEIYEIELNGKPLLPENGGELYTFVQDIVSPTLGQSTVFGMELTKDGFSQTNVFYLSGDKFGSGGIPSTSQLESLMAEVEGGKGSFAPISDGPFQFVEFTHVNSSKLDATQYADTTAPSAPVITSIAGDGVLTEDELSDWSIRGTAEAGSTVTIALDDDPMGAVSTTADSSGAWAFTGADFNITKLSDLPPEGDGDYAFTIKATDAAGNASQATKGTITVDVEQEIQGVGVRFSGDIANMASYVQSRTDVASIAATAKTLRAALKDTDDNTDGDSNQPDVVTLLDKITELQEFDFKTSITEVAKGGEVSLRATAANAAAVLDFGTNSDNLDKTIIVNDYATVIVNGEARIRGGEGSNTFLGDGASQDVMMGADDDMLSAGGGNDTVGSAGGNDTISGGSGDDVAFGGTGNDSVAGDTGNDHILDSWGTDTLNGGEGNDVIRSFDGADTIYAQWGDDTVYGGRGDDFIKGGDGNDVLYGDTVLFSSRGEDTLTGGAGDDLLQGGYGADTFIFNAGTDGNDTIGRIGGGADFESGLDHVHLVGFTGVNATNVMDAISDVSGKAVFDAEGITITFDGIVKADLSAEDFIF